MSPAMHLCIETRKSLSECAFALEQTGNDYKAAKDYLLLGPVQLVDRVRKLEAQVAELQSELQRMKDDNR